jgi:hypothetical protein
MLEIYGSWLITRCGYAKKKNTNGDIAEQVSTSILDILRE